MALSRWLVPGTALSCFLACNGMTTASVEPPIVDGGVVATVDAADADADAPAVPWELDVDAFDRSCHTNGDCRAVKTGPCEPCLCEDAAVNQADSIRYADAFAAELQRTQCSARAYDQVCEPACDPLARALCESGRCVIGRVKFLEMGKYDRACETTLDCVAVDSDLSTGQGCTDAIAKTALAEFEADRAAAPPCGTPEPYERYDCDWMLECNLGQCALGSHTIP